MNIIRFLHYPTKRRKNGFELPWSLHQVLTILLEFSAAVCFYALDIAHTQSNTDLFHFSTVALIVHVVLWVRCETLDPGTVLIPEDNIPEHCHLQTPIKYNSVTPQNVDVGIVAHKRIPVQIAQRMRQTLKHCMFCSCRYISGYLDTLHDKPRYCGFCRKSIDGMDHHCKWLNTCIGWKNYTTFLALVTSGAIAYGIFASLLFLTIASHKTSGELSTSLLYVAVVLSATIGLLFAVLVIAHLFLIVIGKSTYQYLWDQRQKKINKRRGQGGNFSSKQFRKVPRSVFQRSYKATKSSDVVPTIPRVA